MTLTIYPDGSMHTESKHIKKFLTFDPKKISALDSARIKVGDHTITIHAQEVRFEGARLGKVLELMAGEIVALRKDVGILKAKQTKGNDDNPTNTRQGNGKACNSL